MLETEILKKLVFENCYEIVADQVRLQPACSATEID